MVWKAYSETYWGHPVAGSSSAGLSSSADWSSSDRLTQDSGGLKESDPDSWCAAPAGIAANDPAAAASEDTVRRPYAVGHTQTPSYKRRSKRRYKNGSDRLNLFVPLCV